MTPRNFPQDLSFESLPPEEKILTHYKFLFNKRAGFWSVLQPIPFFTPSFSFSRNLSSTKRKEEISTSTRDTGVCKWQHGQRWFTSVVYSGKGTKKNGSINENFCPRNDVGKRSTKPSVAAVWSKHDAARPWKIVCRDRKRKRGSFALSPNPSTRGGVQARSGLAPKASWKKGGGGGEGGRGSATNFLPPRYTIFSTTADRAVRLAGSR